MDDWEKRYSHEDAANVTKAFWPNVKDAYRTIRKLSLKPDIIQMVTGHGAFAAYLWIFKRKDDPKCSCDNQSEQTTIHVLVHCPLFYRKRLNYELECEEKVSEENLKEIIRNKTQETNGRDFFFELCLRIIKKCKSMNGIKI